jgi:predicted dehydrogenase
VTLLGPVRRVTARAGQAKAERKIHSGPRAGETFPVQVPTHVTGVLEHESGALTTVLMSFDIWAARLPRIEIHGTDGSLSVPDPNGFDGTVEIATAANREWTEVPVSGGYAGAGRGVGVADMARALRNGEPHRANGALAFHVLDVLESFVDSAVQDQPLDIASTVERPAAVPLGASPETA